tara:strand:- start:131 stop:505 length:375 start_codon:yes stop_codon:yes gene_type:complete
MNTQEKMLQEVTSLLVKNFLDYSKNPKSHTDEVWDEFSMVSYLKTDQTFTDFYGEVTDPKVMDYLFDSIIKISEDIHPGLNEMEIQDPFSEPFYFWSFIDMIWSGLDWGFGENRESGLKRVFSK